MLRQSLYVLRRDSRPFEATGVRVAGTSAGLSRHKDVRRIAGRGAWTTPAYVPPWATNETDTILDKGWFGPKQGRE